MTQLLNQLDVVWGNGEPALVPELTHLLDGRLDLVGAGFVIDGVARHHVRAKVLVLHRKRETASFIVLVPVMGPGNWHAQPSRHRVNPLDVVEGARSLHPERIDDPYMFGLRLPGD